MECCGSWAQVPSGVKLPSRYPSYQTCHRRFQQWVREGRLERILRELAKELYARRKLDLKEAFIDASFTGAKKGAWQSGATKRGKGTKIIALADDHSLPLAISIESASPHKSQLVEESSDTASSTSCQKV